MSLPTSAEKKRCVVAVVGNPNTGKTTLFNALTGLHQRVANYPGVTVEKKIGLLRPSNKTNLCSESTDQGSAQAKAYGSVLLESLNRGEAAIKTEVVDLPGVYSLTARSADEAVVLNELIGKELTGRTDSKDSKVQPDLILVVVDATNLVRNLFLLTQIRDLELPVVAALTMSDLARAQGIQIDVHELSKRLGVPVVPVVATKGTGIDDLRAVMLDMLNHPASPSEPSTSTPTIPTLPDYLQQEITQLNQWITSQGNGTLTKPHRAELLQVLLEPGGFFETRWIRRFGEGLAEQLAESRRRVAACGGSLSDLEARSRYAWIHDIVKEITTSSLSAEPSKTERLDRLLTHPLAGLMVLIVLLSICFQAIYSWAAPLMESLEGVFGYLGNLIAQVMAPGALQSLLVNGVVAGVGSVLVFLPQILILFLFIAILEDCGYMARAAFLLNRWMGLFGLSGQSLIPLLSSHACAIPGIMATRVIENRRDRLVTILIAPLMSCSARLPVYILMIAVFIPATPLPGGWMNLQAVTLLAMYLIGIVVAIVVAFVAKHTILKGKAQPFLMELPTYKWPMFKTVFYRVYEQGREFCISAGTIIFAVTVLIWVLGYYPRPQSIAADFDLQRQAVMAATHESPPKSEQTFDDESAAVLAEIDSQEAGAYLRQSFLGRVGRLIEPVVVPLGWDWRIGTSVVASFAAREVIIATMGTIYNLGENTDEHSAGLRESVRQAKWPDGRPVFNTAVALSIMVFFALCCQCVSTLAVIKRETRSWRWPLLTFSYMTGLAYVAAFVAYQVMIRCS